VTLRELAIPGAWIIDPIRHHDERGFFARIFDYETFDRHGLATQWRQSSLSFNARSGTVRGLHFQRSPHEEIKLVRCPRGSVHDVIVDLRPASSAFGRHVAVTLSAGNGLALYIPAGVAHGFQTLQDDTEVAYQITADYAAAAAAGVRFDDPALGILWPLPVSVISERDRGLPPFDRGVDMTAAPDTV
jgi:dTDP-4-dehydrorhamnose 3,5-epimerase